ncbi:SURF1 family protein [Teredinibacter franksiae]|jgi:Uncharacterized conserved protein|uniref:SURF1 family protein n=1 Tax=Teredinibacter franksiae TaxID=2761453 RepID=UPI0016298941|nr:SURF1 family protein [Teredinibacter franksiae]
MATNQRLALTLNWKLTAFSVLLLPVLLSLGIWQMGRAQEKQTLQQSWLAEQAEPAVDYREILATAESVRRVYLEGEFYREKFWLIENKQLAGELGYQVVMPFKTQLGDWILVNRGWIKAGYYREDNPTINTTTGVHRITGTLKYPSDSRFIEHKPTEKALNWPHRLLEIDIALMAKQAGQHFEPQALLIDPDSQDALLVNWQPINMTPEKHRGYAVQWFAMAFALCVLWLATNTNILNLIKQTDKYDE